MGAFPGFVLGTDQSQGLGGEGNRALGRFLGAPLGREQATVVGQIVANTITQNIRACLGLESSGHSEVAIGIACTAIVNHPVELGANRPCVMLLCEVVVVEDACVAEPGQGG